MPSGNASVDEEFPVEFGTDGQSVRTECDGLSR